MSFTRKDIFGLKLAIEADSKLSHGAARLGLLVCSYIYNHPQLRFAPDEPFPLPWTLANQLCFGMCQREVYNCQRELCFRGHFNYEGIKGCPGKAHFRLVLANGRAAQPCHPSKAQPCHPRAAKCDIPRAAQKSSPRAAQKGGPLISNSLREEIVNPMEQIGSLRSSGTKGNELAASPKAFEELSAKAKKHFGDWKQTKA